MRATATLRKLAKIRHDFDMQRMVTQMVKAELEERAPKQQRGFAPTSGYATTERASQQHDWHRPTIGFSPNGF